jgi:hypothetical protein
VIDVVVLDGTGFPHGGTGIVGEFVNNLDRARFRPVVVDYPATYGGLGSAYASSRAAGRAAALRAIADSPNSVVLAGYSQGAGIAGDVADEIGRGEHFELDVRACALIADPARPRLCGLPRETPASGYGVSGERAVWGIPTFWAAAEGDPITALPEGNPLRSLADTTEYFSLASPVDAIRWGQALLDRAKAHRWQRWWSIGAVRDWGGAMQYADNYLPPPIGAGRHTIAYLELGLCARLAATINREVRE